MDGHIGSGYWGYWHYTVLDFRCYALSQVLRFALLSIAVAAKLAIENEV